MSVQLWANLLIQSCVEGSSSTLQLYPHSQKGCKQVFFSKDPVFSPTKKLSVTLLQSFGWTFPSIRTWNPSSTYFEIRFSVKERRQDPIGCTDEASFSVFIVQSWIGEAGTRKEKKG